jgi:hypothetical protein
MSALRLTPVILSFLLLGAHFYRSGLPFGAGFCIVMPLLLLVRDSWVPRLIQILLLLGALEWLRTLFVIANMRIAYEQSWTRMAAILGVVALFTALAGLVFRSKALRKRYAGKEPEPESEL